MVVSFTQSGEDGFKSHKQLYKQLWLVRPFTRQKNRARIRRKSGADRITFAVYADEVLQRVGPKNQVSKGAFKPNLYAIKNLDTD